MIKTLIVTLATIGAVALMMVLAYAICKIIDLFERVERLEVKDNVRRDDIRDVQYQIAHIKEKL